MKVLIRSFSVILAFVLSFCSCFLVVSAAENGVVTVGNAEGYPGDIVAVPISITSLPSKGFAAGTFLVSFGNNLEYVSAVQCDNNYGSLTFTRPSDASTEKNVVNIVCFAGLADTNYKYTKQMATVYFRIKSDALPTDDISESTVSVSTSDAINKDMTGVGFDCVSGVVSVAERNSTLGEALVGHSLTLDGEIALNFHVDVPDELLASETAYVEFSINGQQPTVYTEKLSEFRKDNSGNVILSCYLPSPMWSRTVSVRIYDSNGNYGDTYSYSVKNYAMYMLSGNFTTGNVASDTALKDLCVALLNYGGYSQKYFGYFADSDDQLANGNVIYGNNTLISELVTDDYDDVITNDNIARLEGECAGITYKGVTVAVDAATAITHYFAVDGKTEDYVFTLTSPVADALVLAPFESDGQIAVNIGDIPAAYLDMPYTVTVTAVGGEDAGLSVTYSVRSYMAHNLESDIDGLSDLIRAMYLYGISADSYFGK